MIRTTIVLALLTSTVGTAAEVRRDLYGDPLPARSVDAAGHRAFPARRPSGHGCLLLARRQNPRHLWLRQSHPLLGFTNGQGTPPVGWSYQIPIPLAFSPDSKLLASGGLDSTVRLWDVATGKLLHTIKQEGEVVSVVFAHDGNAWRPAAVSAGFICGRWRRANTCARLKEHKQGDGLLSLSPDGNLLASAGRDMICLWDMATGKLVRECGHRHKVHQVQFTDRKTLATCGDDGLIHLWDAATGEEVRQWKTDEREVDTMAFTVAFTVDGQSLLSGGEDGTIRIWNAATGKQRRVLVRLSGAIFSLRLSPDGKTAASLCWDKLLRRWDLASGKRVAASKDTKANLSPCNSPMTARRSCPRRKMGPCASGCRFQ